MSNKFHGDVRPLSHDPVYMGVVFEGLIDEAIAQAKAEFDYGVPRVSDAGILYMLEHNVSRDRVALLQHLNLVAL